MDIGVYSIKVISEEKISKLINEKQSFVLEDIVRRNISEAVSAVERMIESKGLKCRVYLKGRSATVAAAASSMTPVAIGGWASAIGIGLHNLATWDPDYEIAKNPATGTLTVTYKKQQVRLTSASNQHPRLGCAKAWMLNYVKRQKDKTMKPSKVITATGKEYSWKTASNIFHKKASILPDTKSLFNLKTTR